MTRARFIPQQSQTPPPPLAGDAIEFSVGRGADATYSHDSTGLAASVAAAGAAGAARWLVTDHLGTPRMVVDQTGSLAGVTRHDYLPFGEELGVGVGGRTIQQGYAGNADGLRQRFTSAERDDETGLDFMQARYYSSAQARFTSADNFLNDTSAVDPASWNLYVYVRNNPLRYTDPTGEKVYIGGLNTADRNELLKRANYTYGCGSCVSVDKDGFLAVDTSNLNDDVEKATQFLTGAINATNWFGEVKVSNNDSKVAFGQNRPAQGAVTFNGKRINADLIVLDFSDDKHVSGDKASKEAWANLVFAHEVAHGYPRPGLRDPRNGKETGPTVDAVNEIQLALGLPLRATYGNEEVAGGIWLSVPFGKAERDKAGNIRRNATGGIKVKEETSRLIRWYRKNVGGKGIN